MNTFESCYCARHGCSPEAFARKVMLHSMPPPYRPLAAVIALVSPKVFAEDLRLVQYCGEATSMRRIRDEIAGHFSDAGYWSFWRRRLNFRMSTARLKEIARQHLEAGWSAPSGRASDPSQSLPTQ